MKNQNPGKGSQSRWLAAWVWEMSANAVGIALNIWYQITINLKNRPLANWEKNLYCSDLSSFRVFSFSSFLIRFLYNGFQKEWISHANALNTFTAANCQISNWHKWIYLYISTDTDVAMHANSLCKACTFNVRYIMNVSHVFAYIFYMCIYV
jgi:hypothetical protein